MSHSSQLHTNAPASPLIQAGIGALVAWRMMLSPESPELGGTLWVTQFWFLLFCIWSLYTFARYRDRFHFRWTLTDTLLWLIVAGHWISAGMLWVDGGDKRAALNVCWEWTALGTSLFLIRQSLTAFRDAGGLLRLLLQMSIPFAALGIWQHYVEYPALWQEYQSLTQTKSTLLKKVETEPLTPADRKRLVDADAELSKWPIPAEIGPRMMFRHKLEVTREPVARWALTNTLGGWLAAALIVLLAVVQSAFRDKRISRPMLVVMAIAAVPIAVCLWLTNSRTAWVAAAAGVGVLLLSPYVRKHPRLRKLALLVPLALAIVFALLVLVTMSGGFDGTVEGSVSKSLKYRAEYLVSTSRLLADHPLFGSGPGNFRQRYVTYKLPQASEEIADPHNLFLDLWANGGLMALLAFVALLTRLLLPSQQHDRPPSGRGPPATETNRRSNFSWQVGAVVAIIALWFWSWLTALEPEWELLAIAGAVVALECLFALGGGTIFAPIPRLACGAGLIVLGVHLLGAGGIEMPAIVQAALILVAVMEAPHSSDHPQTFPRWTFAALFAIAFGLFFTCQESALRPVTTAQSLIADAQFQLRERRNAAAARADLKRAAAADPLSPDPWRELAFLEFSQWLQAPDDDAAFRRGKMATSEAHNRDPWNYRDDRRLAEACFRRFQSSGDSQWAARAAEAYERALRRYPYQLQMLQEFALAAAAAGFTEKAAPAAKKAIELDDFYRKEGHVEKMLSPPQREALVAIAAAGASK